MAKRGSIPLEQSAMMDSVPVGAMVVSVAFLSLGAPGRSYTEPPKFGKAPRFSARAADSARAAWVMNSITSSASARAFFPA